MNDLFMWFIFIWCIALISLLFIGGFFMFRKFLKRLPKVDGWSELDWQDYYIRESLPLWTEEKKSLLNEFVSPVPDLFKDVAKEKIAGHIAKIALEEKTEEITTEQMIRGYIIATPKRDHKFLVKKLKQLNIPIEPYKKYFKMSRD
ncbi:DUF2621 family protein [Abyssicoccus albus]|uniref:Uncharacterized protein DUF2621 n=1 Tax=Abyssicoccus albus TaxID=1817405 RepID=A0A1Q1G1L1_9BACL|nr:DUF2621 family protein [Abyssicoccus albus]AQL56242.1 hypothetical protein BVH56_04590 [Abyssicoccus albus]RPF57933.1 uncharacterized protein DUF2621 [Abyssicoccus albus]